MHTKHVTSQMTEVIQDILYTLFFKVMFNKTIKTNGWLFIIFLQMN